MLKDTSFICKYALVDFLFPEMSWLWQCSSTVRKQFDWRNTINRVVYLSWPKTLWCITHSPLRNPSATPAWPGACPYARLPSALLVLFAAAQIYRCVVWRQTLETWNSCLTFCMSYIWLPCSFWHSYHKGLHRHSAASYHKGQHTVACACSKID